jgi:hypothetical protein
MLKETEENQALKDLVIKLQSENNIDGSDFYTPWKPQASSSERIVNRQNGRAALVR